ncbi:neuroglobin-like [Anneissia japonica]|uniref:neuroglobin-like n=1 Tax=Anneissia japonica TaxID=1529436 RepID=UPI0014257074|nr:neuroglobin-like [Anneissia japonica]
MSLTINEISLITDSWKHFTENFDSNGANIFMRLFDQNPELLPLFPFGKRDRTEAELRRHPLFKRHVRGVMNTIDTAVKTVENLNNVVPTLTQLGRKHAMYGVKPAFFQAVENALVYALEQALQDACTNDHEQAWRKLFKVISGTMSVGLEQK